MAKIGRSYGAVMTQQDAARFMEENNRDYNNRKTWQSLLSQNANEALAAENQLVNDYSKVTAQAYASYLQNKNAIQNSAYVGAGKQTLLSENELALQDAYKSYRNSLLQGEQEIASAAASGEQSITKAFDEQAQFTADYANAHRGYLEELWQKYQNGENKLFDDMRWERYITNDPVLDAEGKEQFDEEGNRIEERRLKTQEEMAAELYDENGNLTLAGLDYFDQLENSLANEGGYSWGQYLLDTNEDLYNWSKTYNPYNYTFEGTNAGSFRTMVGMAADDNDWSFAERYGGMDEEQISGLYNKFYDAANKLADKKAGTETISDYKDLVDETVTLVKELGLESELADAGLDVNNLTEQFEYFLNRSEKMDDTYAGEALAETGMLMGTGAGLGFSLGSVLPGIGNAAGALAGFIVGSLGSIANAIHKRQQKDIDEKQYTAEVREAYANMLNQLTNYNLKKKRQIEIDFQNR